MSDLLQELIKHTHAPQFKRRHLVACPKCGRMGNGKDETCSFGPDGWHCFKCGAGGTLTGLAKLVNLEGEYGAPELQSLPETPKPVATWRATPEKWLTRFESHPLRDALWQAYKPLRGIDTLRYGVGRLGSLPYGESGHASACNHERLIVPIFDGTMLVSLRGRQISRSLAEAVGAKWEGCQCAKWAQAAGSNMDEWPMYGETDLTPGCTAAIVENTVDAKFLTQETDIVGLAIYSTSCTAPFAAGGRWREALLKAGVKRLIVWLDNDLVGNGGALRRREFLTMHQEKCAHDFVRHNPGKPIPQSFPVPVAAAWKIMQYLKDTGIELGRWDWRNAPHKADCYGLLSGQVTL